MLKNNKKKYSLNTLKVKPVVVTEYNTIAGDPIFAPNCVIKVVLILGFFFPKKYPIPTTKNTGNITSKSFRYISIL